MDVIQRVNRSDLLLKVHARLHRRQVDISLKAYPILYVVMRCDQDGQSGYEYLPMLHQYEVASTVKHSKTSTPNLNTVYALLCCTRLPLRVRVRVPLT
jgi:hypothetical protein